MTNLKNWLAIVNPFAGGIRSANKRNWVIEQIRRSGAHIAVTEHAGHARELAGCAGSYYGVLVAGGDGTLLDVLNAGERRRLAIIPCGRGNSLARDLGLYPVARAFQAIESGCFERVDLMEAAFADTQGRRFQMLSASTIAVGYPTTVVQIAGDRFRWLGKYCYAAAAAGLTPALMEVRTSPETAADRPGGHKRLTGFVANNTRHLGNFVALPEARCHDGHFEVMEMSAGFLSQSLHNVSALSRLQFYTPAKLRSTTDVSLTLSSPQDLLVDGEIFPDVASLRVSLRKSAVRIAVPKSLKEQRPS
jgi:diacylglycerol kinase family enzyme